MLKQWLAPLKANRRLRLGLAAVVAILLLNTLLDQRDQLDQLRLSYTKSLAMSARLQGDVRQSEWPARKTEAEARLVSMDERLWHQPTPGLAQAVFQEEISKSLVRVKATRPNVTLAAVDTTPSDDNHGLPADLRALRAKVELDFNPEVINALLLDFAHAKQRIIVESVQIKQQPPRVEMIVQGHAVIAAAQAK